MLLVSFYLHINLRCVYSCYVLLPPKKGSNVHGISSGTFCQMTKMKCDSNSFRYFSVRSYDFSWLDNGLCWIGAQLLSNQGILLSTSWNMYHCSDNSSGQWQRKQQSHTTGPLRWESTGDRWSPLRMGQFVESTSMLWHHHVGRNASFPYQCINCLHHRNCRNVMQYINTSNFYPCRSIWMG